MDLKRLTNRAKDLVEKRGGADSVKEDAGELKDIATGKGALKDKAKAAAEAIKEPGAGGDSTSSPERRSADQAG
jgi:hypothetical protein